MNARNDTPVKDIRARASARSDVIWIAVFVALTATLAIPFLVVHEPPLLDYANHLARGFILDHLHDPAYSFSEYYAADWKPYPYVLWDLLLVGLEQVLPVELAGKSLLIIATLLLPVSVAWFLWQANRTEIKLALLACALSYYTLFLWGFTAYQLGVDFCFLMVGTWLWYRRDPSLLRAACFVLATFGAYFAHLLGFAAGAFILVLYEVSRFAWRRWLELAGFLAPPSLLFLWARPGLSQLSSVEWRSFPDKMSSLRDIPTEAYDQTLDNVFIAGLVLCVLVAVVRNRELGVNWRWLIALGGLFLIYLLLPYGWGAGFDLDVRFVPPLCLLSLAVLRVGPRARWIGVVAVALTLLRVFNVASGFRDEAEKSPAMDRAIEHVAKGATVFPLVDTCKDEDPLDYYYVHYWAYAVIRRGAISPYLFDIPGQTPMRITYEAYTPEGYWAHCYDTQPEWELVGVDYDYIWSYGANRYGKGISEVADKVYAEGPVVLYKVRRQDRGD